MFHQIDNSTKSFFSDVGTGDSLKLSFCWPSIPSDAFAEDVFVGAWHPRKPLQVCMKIPREMDASWVASRNWVLLSSTSPVHKKPNGLVHATELNELGEKNAVAFRGYLLTPALHSWSSPDNITTYWTEESHFEHNGVFSAVRICENGQSIELITDAFGISPLYYRLWNGILLFATNARFLAIEGDTIDLIAARDLIEAGYLCGNLSLGSGIRRVDARQVMRFTGDQQTTKSWFDFATLPLGDETITKPALQEIENCFQNSIDRCLRLPTRRKILPLSSGYDSRRILAALMSRKVSFDTRTVRVLNKKLYDIDGYWADVMAREIGFSHEIIEMPCIEEFVANDQLRRVLTDSEVIEHTWIMQLTQTLPNESSLLFDGCGGDIFNNTGYAIRELYTCPDDEKLQIIARRLIPGTCSLNLLSSRWPTVEQMRAHVVEYLSNLPNGKLRADLAFVLLRARRGTGTWSQTMVPAGHVAVLPYFDLDYVRLTLRFDPLEKIDRFIQDRCLAEFWPDYYAYPGTRRMPPNCKQADQSLLIASRIGCLRKLFSETEQVFSGRKTREWLSLRGMAAVLAAAYSDRVALRAHWWLYPLLSALARHNTTAKCWKIE